VAAQHRLPPGRCCDDVSRAAFGGHLEVVTWLYNCGCPWVPSTCAAAASGGHLEVLRWAREHGAPSNEDTSRYAANGGHLEMVVWLLDNDCPWDLYA
jgi:hypothetical protein